MSKKFSPWPHMSDSNTVQAERFNDYWKSLKHIWALRHLMCM